MKIPNLSRSYLTFRIDFEKKDAVTVSHPPPYSLNNARIQLESRCQIYDRQEEKEYDYLLGASCKTERVCVENDIWLDPNADFCPVLSQDEFLDLKSWARIGGGPLYHPPSLGRQRERTVHAVADAFDRVDFHLEMVEAEPIHSPQEIVEATLANDLLSGRVEFTAQNRYEVTIDFPIKTMNANERDQVYQTDTGPILFPDFSRPFDRLVETFWLAYVAYNRSAYAEFIVQQPTTIAGDIAVNHYSRPVQLNTRNTTFRLLD